MIPLGVTTYSTVEETAAANREAMQMRKLGHSILLYETYDHDNKFLSAFATHCQTCHACAEIKQEDKKG